MVLCSHAFRQRDAFVSRSADVCQDGAADLGRHAGGLEHLHGVLSGGAPGRILVRPFLHKMAGQSAAGDPAHGDSWFAVLRAAHRARHTAGPDRRRKPYPLAALDHGGFRGDSLFRRFRKRAAVAKVVCRHGPSGRQGSVFPLCRQQPGQHDRAVGVSDRGGTVSAAGRPIPGLAIGLHAARNLDRRLRGVALAFARQNSSGGWRAAGNAPLGCRRCRGTRSRTSRTCAGVEPADPLAGAVVRPLQPAPRRDELHFDRLGGSAAPLGHPAGASIF